MPFIESWSFGSVGSAIGSFFSPAKSPKPAKTATATTVPTGTGKLPRLPGDQAKKAPTGSSKLSLDDPRERGLDVSAAGKRLKAKFGAEDAWGRALYLRDHNPRDPGFKENDKAFREAAGLSRPLSKTELRDLEHFLYASMATQEGFAANRVRKGDGTLTRAGKALDRGVKAAGMATATLGYSTAKWIGQNTPVDPLKALGGDSNSPGTTKASWREVGAGLRGIRDGMADPEAR